ESRRCPSPSSWRPGSAMRHFWLRGYEWCPKAARRLQSPICPSGFTSGLPFTHQENLRHETDSEAVFDSALNSPDEGQNVLSRRTAEIDDEVGMDRGDLGPAFPRALQAGSFDQPGGMVARRIAEHAARGCLLQRLRA